MMNEEQQLIIETSRRILTDLCLKDVIDASENGQWASELWKNFEDTGLTLASIAEDLGGSGGQDADSLLIIREAAGFAAPIPLAETYIAATLLSRAGAKSPAGPMAVASGDVVFNEKPNGIEVTGQLHDIAQANYCDHLLIANASQICLIATAGLDFGTQKSLAGEPVGTIDLQSTFATGQLFSLADAKQQLLELGAVTRVNMMAGAMSTTLNLSVQYSLEREQFGRAISQFQAVQQQLAMMAGEVAACQRAADSVLDNPSAFDIAVAKARVGEAVESVTDIAHQVHGAMGYTMEHGLNLRTRRLWSWRNEFGNETFWQKKIGEQVCEGGADELWPLITSVA